MSTLFYKKNQSFFACLNVVAAVLSMHYISLYSQNLSPNCPMYGSGLILPFKAFEIPITRQYM